MRKSFEDQLELLNNELIQMGALVERAIACAVKALIEQDVKQAKRAIDCDIEVDHKEKEIENICFKLLLQQQPVAKDLRLISSALKMITDMERIGDQAADISEITMLMADTPYVIQPDHITDMARATIKMVTDSVDAFVKRDLNLAQSVVEYDDNVDNLFTSVKSDLIKLIHENVDKGEQAVDFLLVAKYFERIGDNAVDVYKRQILYNGKNYYTYTTERIQTKNTHGTGCTFSSAIASNLANGMNINDAVKYAKEYITNAIKYSLNIGKGHGPTNHLYNFYNSK